MKKSIFLFFAAILCAMTANAQLYLRGGFNDWGTGDKFQFVDNVCEIELAGGTTYEFKIASSSWNPEYGTGTFTATATKTLTFKGGNMKITTTIPGTYRFEFVEGTKKLTVTYPELPAPHDITVRAQVPASWTNTITAWVWTSENGDGEEVTPTKDGDYYVVTKNAGALYAIFKNGAGWNGDKNQTVDLCYTEDVCLQLNQSGTAKATATVIDCGAVSKDITVKAVVPGAWENEITAWVWPTGGEGKEVTPTKDGNWYVVTENCIELNVIFKNGKGWNGDENQTVNIEGVSENICYQISALNKVGNKCSVTEVDCEAAIEPEAKPVDVYTVVGSSNELGLAWDPTKKANDMEKQDDGSYKKVYSNVELTTSVEWKIAKNGDWWNETPLENKAANGNSVLTISKSGIYNVTFTLSKDLKTAHAEAELLEETNTVADCFISGNAALTGGEGWKGNEFKMEYDDATETYSYTLTGLATDKAYELKIVLGGAWYSYANLSTVPTGVTKGNDDAIAFKMAEAGDVTVTYNIENGITINGNFYVAVKYDYYITGCEKLGANWGANVEAFGMTDENEDKTYEKALTLAAGEYYLKVTDGTWNEGKNWGSAALSEKYTEILDSEGNIKITLTAEKTFTVKFNSETKKISFEGLTPDETPTKYYIVGSFNEWNTADPNYELILNDGVYKKEVTFAKDVQFKVCDGTWVNSWGKDNLGGKLYNELAVNGENIQMKEDKTFTIIFDLANNLITFDGLTEKAPAVVTYVLMGVNNDWTTGIPMTQNPDPDKASEYVLTCQAIAAADAVKVVKCEDGTPVAWYGSVKDEVQVTVTKDANDNIQLPAGTYNFYFDSSLDDKQLWIESATYTRTVTSGNFGTICLPYAGTISNATLFVLSYKDENYVYVDEIGTTLEAGKPYLFLPTSTEITVNYTDDTYKDAGVNGALHGTYVEMGNAALMGKYIISGNKYYLINNATGNSILPENRAYFELSEVSEVAPVMPVGARRIALGTNGQNTATGMENVDASAQPVKTIINGQLYILRGEKMYDAQGKLVK